jgi:ribosomal protection tetracycline resistance protein
MRTLNLGILAHVDAGKTSLTERLLHAAGVIDEIGSVDDGNTQTDTLPLERQRGITIKSAVVSFVVDDVTINLIDTPGHPDFIAEVERVLSVLDGAVLVVSAVEGVQSQTVVLTRALQRLRIPYLIYVNKIDRGGAQCEPALQAIAERLTPAAVAMGSVRDPGTRPAAFLPYGANDVAFRDALSERLVDHDDAMLAAYLDGATTVPYTRLRAALAAQTKRALVHPVFFGSAITGEGVTALVAGLTELLPAPEGDVDGPVSGTVFKVERGVAGEKTAYVRMFSGTVRTRDRVRYGDGTEQKVTAIGVFEHGSAVARASVAAGQIGKLRGLTDIQIGDAVGIAPATSPRHRFAPPTLETVVVPCVRSDRSALHVALSRLAEQDPLIGLRRDDVQQELFVSLYGEVQKEVVKATLASDFGIPVEFRETTTICVERPTGTGAAVEIIGTARNPFHATIGLRIDPASTDSGVEYRLEVELGSIPLPFHRAVEEAVHATLRQGLYGWQVTDCTVTMTHSGFWSRPGSNAADFRNLTPLVVMSALQRAGTVVCEPFLRFHLEAPIGTLGPTLPTLARLHAVPDTSVVDGARYVLEGCIPAARSHELQQQLPALGGGEGVLDTAFDSYRPVRGTFPSRPRTDNNPLNRKDYLLHVRRVVGTIR